MSNHVSSWLGSTATTAASATAVAAGAGQVTGIVVSPTLYHAAAIGLGFLGVILARTVYIDQENKRLRRRQSVRETLPLTLVALLIAMPIVFKNQDKITVTPLLGLGVGYTALLLLKLIGRAVIVGTRTFAKEIADALSDTPMPPGESPVQINDLIEQLDRVDDVPGGKV